VPVQPESCLQKGKKSFPFYCTPLDSSRPFGIVNPDGATAVQEKPVRARHRPVVLLERGGIRRRLALRIMNPVKVLP
jgi:hypothetical protein